MVVRGPADTLAARTVEHRMEDEKAIPRIRRVASSAARTKDSSAGKAMPEVMYPDDVAAVQLSSIPAAT